MPETPDWLCAIVQKLHAKNPDDRFQSAREVADLLAYCEAKLKAKQVVKYVLPAAKPPLKQSRLKWAIAVVVLLLPLIVLAVTEVVGLTNLFRQQEKSDIIESQSIPTSELVTQQETAPLTVAPVNSFQGRQLQEAWAKSLNIPIEYTNSLDMKFQLTPPGQFNMGSPREEINRCMGLRLELGNWLNAEVPEHDVEITQAFYLMSTEVTVGQFRQFVDEKNYSLADVR